MSELRRIMMMFPRPEGSGEPTISIDGYVAFLEDYNDTAVSGSRIKSDGTTETYSGWNISGYVEIPDDARYVYFDNRFDMSYSGIYNNSKTYLYQLTGNTELPSSAKYIRISDTLDNVNKGSLIFLKTQKPIVLPYDAEVEYLESTGSAFIDTGITPTLAYSVECVFTYVSPFSSSDASGTLFGCLTGWNSYTYMCAVNPSGTSYNCWGNKNTSLANASSYWNSLFGDWHLFEFIPKSTYIDNVKKFTDSTGTGNPTTSMYLFCAHHPSGTNGCYGVGTTKRIKYTKIYDANNTLVRHFIPVRVGQTGYMYDKISGELFGNEGSGDFTYGNDIIT